MSDKPVTRLVDELVLKIQELEARGYILTHSDAIYVTNRESSYELLLEFDEDLGEFTTVGWQLW